MRELGETVGEQDIVINSTSRGTETVQGGESKGRGAGGRL